MPDPSWNTYTPTAPSSIPGWLKVLAGLALAGALLIAVLVTTQVARRRQAWPLARAVAARLATDEGTRDLYEKNPDLHDDYPTEQAFLDAVRPLRAGLILPEQEPLRNRRGFITFVGPVQARIRVRGEGGTWMDLTVRRRSTFGPEPHGEGIANLLLADSREGLRAQLTRIEEARFEPQWQRFRETATLLATEGGARALLDRPGLSHTPGEATAFLTLRQMRQAGLAALPATRTEAHAHLSLRNGPFHRDVRMTCPLPGGGSLSLAWRDDRLTDLTLD
jgi:hypothetical protein